MNRKRLALIIGGIVLLMVAIPLFVSAKALVPEQDCARLIAEDGRGVTICLDVLETPIHPTNIPPTDTPIPPTDTPTPVSLPLCSTHNDREWHSLLGDGCHYNHEHGDDPHLADGILGTDFYDIAGGSISYPWETANENELKHEGYKWFVGPSYRIQYHGIFANPGMVARFHSFYFEFAPSSGGVIRAGGHANTGALKINAAVCVDLGDNACIDNPDHYRAHYVAGDPLENHAQWVYSHRPPGGTAAEFRIRMNDVFHPIDPVDVFNSPYFCPEFDCGSNGSLRELTTFGMSLTSNADISTFRDINGLMAPGCVEAGPNCVPFELSGLSTLLESPPDLPRAAEYDLSPPGEFWIEYPN